MFDKKAEAAPVAEPENDQSETKGLASCAGYWAVQIVPGRKLKMLAGGQANPATFTIPLPPGKVAALSAIGPSVLLSSGDLLVWLPQREKWERVGNLNDATR